MAVSINHFMSAVLILWLLTMISLDSTVAQIGVCYGLNNGKGGLPSPCEVVSMYDNNDIQRMRIYEPDSVTLQALNGATSNSAFTTAVNPQGRGGGSIIEVALGANLNYLQFLASSQDNADAWVKTYIIRYPNVRFNYIVVGNEVSPVDGDRAKYGRFVYQAMINVRNAVNRAGLGNQIGVTTAVGTNVLRKSYPPEDGEFRDEATEYLDRIIQFLLDTGAPIFVNVYPYFSYIWNKARISLQYALLQPNSGITVPSGVRYDNLLYAIVDAMYSAMEKRSRRGRAPKIVVGESGWPSFGGEAASLENANIYNKNLIRVVKNGTPKRPGEPIETYIFAMFDERDKPGAEVERHFGIFTADGQPKYSLDYN